MTDGYSESRTPTIDDQTLTHSFTLAPFNSSLSGPHIDNTYVSESQDDDGDRSAVITTISIVKDENESQDDLP